MKRLFTNLSGALLVVGILLVVGSAETLNMPCIGVGLGCMAVGAIISKCLEKAEEINDAEDDR